MVAELAAVKPCTTKAASRIFVALLWSFGDRVVVWRRPSASKALIPQFRTLTPPPFLLWLRSLWSTDFCLSSVVRLNLTVRLLSVVRFRLNFNRKASGRRPLFG